MLRGLNEELAFPLLLARPQIHHSKNPLSAIAGKRVMVTGAGGSIGSELVMQIASMAPACLILAELSEYNLYEINASLAQAEVAFEVRPLLADVRHAYAMGRLFEDTLPDLVFHAAALKHVPLLENDHNLIEAVRTNVTGTSNITKLCSAWSAALVVVSTDKAVNPSSVMGLTKRAAELVAMAHMEPMSEFALSIVRFGNVLGSSGSFVPLFRRQIAQGGPVTVTHKHMRRFLMTIKEAVSLVLTAAQHMAVREAYVRQNPPYLYVLEMGKQVLILDIANQLIQQSGLRPGEDIQIQFTGIRPGEKLEEELFYSYEHLVRHVIPGVSGCRIRPVEAPGRTALALLEDAAEERDVEEVKELLRLLVPSYSGTDACK
jgi:O-antigen biosynthesis protein WbqV